MTDIAQDIAECSISLRDKIQITSSWDKIPFTSSSLAMTFVSMPRCPEFKSHKINEKFICHMECLSYLPQPDNCSLCLIQTQRQLIRSIIFQKDHHLLCHVNLRLYVLNLRETPVAFAKEKDPISHLTIHLWIQNTAHVFEIIGNPHFTYGMELLLPYSCIGKPISMERGLEWSENHPAEDWEVWWCKKNK